MLKFRQFEIRLRRNAVSVWSSNLMLSITPLSCIHYYYHPTWLQVENQNSIP